MSCKKTPLEPAGAPFSVRHAGIDGVDENYNKNASAEAF